MNVLLLISLLLPLAGAALLGGGRDWARRIALAVTLAVLGVAVFLAARYPGGTAPFAATDWPWLAWTGTPIDVRFSVGLDGLSLWLYALTALLMVVAVLLSWEAIEEQGALYYRLLLALETGMLGVFLARDIILFYVFFEFTLIPLFFLIGIWGSKNRRWAAIKFFLFTLAGSVLTFLGLLFIVLWVYHHPTGATAGRLTFSIPELTAALRLRPMDPTLQIWIFIALFAGFAVKAPLWPLHTWLPLAHVEAPAAGSVLLAGVLLKVGVYGFARFSLPMLPDAAAVLMPWLLWISLAGVIYGALVALAQSDLKRLIAYSSVSHLGFVALGLFAANRLSVEGGVLQMVNHGLATGGLFAVVGMLYERFHSREIADFGGLARRFPRLAFFTMVFTLSSIALPGLAGFAGEFPLLAGVFQRGWAEPLSPHAGQLRTIAVLSLAGVVLGAWYMLWLYQRIFFGPEKMPKTSPLPLGEGPGVRAGQDSENARHQARIPNQQISDSSSTGPHPNPLPKGEGTEGSNPLPKGEGAVRDLSPREIFCLTPLVVMIFWIGVQPGFFFDRMKPTLDHLIAPVMEACETADTAKPQAALAPQPQSHDVSHEPLTTSH